MAKKKRYRGHFCKVCGRIRPNEKFSGRGHTIHICKPCAKKPKEKQDEGIALTRIYRVYRYGNLSRNNWQMLEKYSRSPQKRIRRAALEAIDTFSGGSIPVETNLDEIREFSKIKETANWEFRSFLKRCDLSEEEIDSIVHKLYQKVSSEINCRKCANCCKEIQPVLDEEDIESFSRGLGITVIQFKDQYLVKDDESEKFKFNKKPCPFLKDNLCSYYNYRPKACRSYPHLHKSEFVSRLINVVRNYAICPIIFNVYELLKEEAWQYRTAENYEDFSGSYNFIEEI